MPKPTVITDTSHRACLHCGSPITPRARFESERLSLVVYSRVVEIELDGQTIILGGQHGHLLGEIVACGGTVAAEILEVEVSGGMGTKKQCEKRINSALERLRIRLKELDVPSLIVRDGTGLVRIDLPGVYS